MSATPHSNSNLHVSEADRWKAAGVPLRHCLKATALSSDPCETNSDAAKWFAAFDKARKATLAGGIVCIVGPRGLGKTQMATCLLMELCKEGKTVLYRKAIDFFRDLRESFRDGGPSEVGTVNKLARVGGLVLDDVHERASTEWEDRTLVNVIDRRYDEMKATVLIANLNRDQFGDSIGPSIVSRVHECGVVIECDWGSFREGPR
jgi:DNA replication protein DnaC